MKRLWVVVDVEANGPAPGLFSMTSFGAVVVEPELNRTFLAGLELLPDAGIDEDHASVDFSKVERGDPALVMKLFAEWLDSLVVGTPALGLGRYESGMQPIFVSDNVAFDWQFINWYFWKFVGRNPFGWSGRRIGDLYAGLRGDARARWKDLRKTKHDHNPVNDARGNAEALLEILKDIKGVL